MKLPTCCLLLAAVRFPAAGLPASVAVYQSETNAAEYHGVYEEPLRLWLTARGQEFTIIGDAVASDPGQLRDVAVVVASSQYLIPQEAARGLAKYVSQGGALLWIDSPARCHDPQLRAALGIGPASGYAPMRDCHLRVVQPGHPACISVSDLALPALVGNPALAADAQGTVLYEMRGSLGGREVTYPAVTLGTYGTGRAICINWVPWLNTDPAVRAVLADALDYLLGTQALAHAPVALMCTLHHATVVQPGPILASVKVFQLVDTLERPGRCELALVGSDGAQLGPGHAVTLVWSHADALVAAGTATVELPTADLPDGDYTVTCSLSVGGVNAAAPPQRATLEGLRRAQQAAAEKQRHETLAPLLIGTLGDYDSEPRTPEGRVDIPRLLEQITTAHMTAYDWLIWHAPTDWEDLQVFLPLARECGVKVWVTVCPPSEQGNGMPFSEPFRLDFIRWAEEIGKLAREHSNLVAWVIDDFRCGVNDQLFTPQYIALMAQVLRSQSPTVALLPTLYWSHIGDPLWLAEYGPSIDGIVFPYADLESTAELPTQLQACRQWLGPHKFLIVNVYASGSSGPAETGPRTAEYLRQALTLSREHADGIRLYCLPKDKLLADYRYAITAELYGKWNEETRQED